ncbi:LPS O-antigen chain length determinant protein WzzB [Aurantivibrio infirmus]
MNTQAQTNRKRIAVDLINDEVDLIELVALLWRGKWIVVGVMLIFGIASVWYLKITPSIYRIDAILDETSSYRLQRIQPSKLKGGEEYQVQPVNLEIVYSTALAHANSLYVKKLFWQQSAKERGISQPNGIEYEKYFKVFSNNLSVTVPDTTIPDSSLHSFLALESKNPKESTQLLKAYLDFVDRHTIAELIDQLTAGYTTSLLKLESDYDSLIEQEKRKLADELVRLKESLEVARALNIVETPYDEVENVELGFIENRQYLLGTRVLNEEIKSISARQQKPLAAFVPLLRNMEHWKEQLENDLRRTQGAEDVVNSFVIVSPPQATLDPIKPKKLLIFIASLVVAGVLGVIIIFVREGVKSYRSRNIGN